MKWLLIFLLAPFALNAQKRTSLPYQNDKVVYVDSFDIKDNFEKTVKIALANYASHYNTKVSMAVNKMKDYIIYSDSTSIIAEFKFLTNQASNEALWDARVTFTKSASGILCRIDNIHAEDMFIYGIGRAKTDGAIESVDKKNKKLSDLVDKQVMGFIVMVRG